jgi:hypothetical protein
MISSDLIVSEPISGAWDSLEPESQPTPGQIQKKAHCATSEPITGAWSSPEPETDTVTSETTKGALEYPEEAVCVKYGMIEVRLEEDMSNRIPSCPPAFFRDEDDESVEYEDTEYAWSSTETVADPTPDLPPVAKSDQADGGVDPSEVVQHEAEVPAPSGESSEEVVPAQDATHGESETLFIQHIPSHVTREGLKAELETAKTLMFPRVDGRILLINLMYLESESGNRGIANVVITPPALARGIAQTLHGRHWVKILQGKSKIYTLFPPKSARRVHDGAVSTKVCQVSPSQVQGYKQNVEMLRNSSAQAQKTLHHLHRAIHAPEQEDVWLHVLDDTPIAEGDQTPDAKRKTVFAGGLPNNLTKDQFILELDDHGYQDKFSSVYLPKGDEKKCNLGYCLVEFLDHEIAVEFISRFPSWGPFQNHPNSRKIKKADWAAREGGDKMGPYSAPRQSNCAAPPVATSPAFMPFPAYPSMNGLWSNNGFMVPTFMVYGQQPTL